MQTAELISVENVSVTLQDQRALDRVSFRLHAGMHTAVHGRNGSGKSTLMRLLRGEIYPDQESGGRVFWHTADGADPSPMTGREMVALVSPALLELYVRQGWNLSGEELILSGFSDGPLLYSAPAPEELEQARALADSMGIAHLLKRGVATLSQGQLCLLFLARACVTRPRVLLLDEFSNGLDTQSRKRMMGILEALAPASTLVVASHRRGSLPAFLKREIRLESGRIRSDGPFRQPDIAVRTAPAPSNGPAAVPPRTTAKPLVRIQKATVYVDRTPVLHEIDWTIQQGEQWILSGANGAGKSTLLRLIAGEEHPAVGGSIQRHFPGHGGEVADREGLGRAISLVSDRLQATYGYDLSGEDLVLSGFDNSIGLYREPLDSELEEAGTWMERLHVTSLKTRNLRSLSTGQLRTLLLARALVRGPELLLLDEPFSGLDDAARGEMTALLDQLIREGRHLILVTHHEGDKLPAMTHVARLENGRLVETGPRGIKTR